MTGGKQFQLFSWHSLAGTELNQENLLKIVDLLIQDSKWVPPEHKFEA
jgi:hypothetical protein